MATMSAGLWRWRSSMILRICSRTHSPSLRRTQGVLSAEQGATCEQEKIFHDWGQRSLVLSGWYAVKKGRSSDWPYILLKGPQDLLILLEYYLLFFGLHLCSRHESDATYFLCTSGSCKVHCEIMQSSLGSMNQISERYPTCNPLDYLRKRDACFYQCWT